MYSATGVKSFWQYKTLFYIIKLWIGVVRANAAVALYCVLKSAVVHHNTKCFRI